MKKWGNEKQVNKIKNEKWKKRKENKNYFCLDLIKENEKRWIVS